MAHEFHLPDVGEGLTEAVVVSWYVAVGDEVAMDAPLVEVETDKAIIDIPSPHAGVLLHQGAQPGDTIAVEALLAENGLRRGDALPVERLRLAGAQAEGADQAFIAMCRMMRHRSSPRA